MLLISFSIFFFTNLTKCSCLLYLEYKFLEDEQKSRRDFMKLFDEYNDSLDHKKKL